jgi:hypothetical protein
MLSESQIAWVRLRTEWGQTTAPRSWAISHRPPKWDVYANEGKRRLLLGQIPEVPTARDALRLLETAISEGYSASALTRLASVLAHLTEIPT